MDRTIIDEIKKKILSQYQPGKLVLFGSAASGDIGKVRDIDLCVINDNIKNKSEEFIKLRKIIGRTILPLDILILTRKEFERRKDIWGTVQYEIDKKGKVLYESK